VPLVLEKISKGYPQLALCEVSLALAAGEILSLLGPSGCGKTSLLRVVAGLDRPDSGRVFFEGLEITGLPPHRRRFGLMFQEYALFPHLNVEDNVAFGLQMLRRPAAEVGRRVAEMLALTGLTGLARRSIAGLSGGERQRVALARSLAPRPRLLMLDEPLAALDRGLRERLMGEIRSILKGLALPALFVTHDQTEAMALGDRVAVMNGGRIVQTDSAERLYRSPADPFVARFLGFRNLIAGEVTPDGAVATVLGSLRPPRLAAAPGSRVTVVLRPEAASLIPGSAGCGAAELRGQVTERVFVGQRYRLTLRLGGGQELQFDLPGEPPPPACGAPIVLAINPRHLAVLAAG
jgi:ABC-type Fe3+/spermidine/putrescine transport system ATPase subunit